jgi:hypothetical protein
MYVDDCVIIKVRVVDCTLAHYSNHSIAVRQLFHTKHWITQTRPSFWERTGTFLCHYWRHAVAEEPWGTVACSWLILTASCSGSTLLCSKFQTSSLFLCGLQPFAKLVAQCTASLVATNNWIHLQIVRKCLAWVGKLLECVASTPAGLAFVKDMLYSPLLYYVFYYSTSWLLTFL